jgi:lysozyme
MTISDDGLALIKSAEGLRLSAYLCPANVWTIGYGTTRGVKAGQAISAIKAEELLREDVRQFERAVSEAVDVPITQGQFDALVSLVYNIGTGAFKKSTLLRLLNQSRYAEAAAQFARWNKGGGKVLPGLVKRRAAERKLFEGTA